MLRSILPHPLLSLTLALVWILAANDLSGATVLMAACVGIVVAKATSAYWPQRPRIRHPLLVVEYIAVFVYDVVVSNVQVARLVLFQPAERLRSRFVEIPLDLRTPEAIVALAGTITLTPGTLSVDVSADLTALHIHCLDTSDTRQVAENIKRRYESRLRRIFE